MTRGSVQGVSALDLVRPAKLDRVVTLTLSTGFALLVLVLWLTPWQQTAPATGQVIAYAPEERRQNIEAPVEGRIARWHVKEGAQVRAGDALVDLSDNDPSILTRLAAERAAASQRIDAARERARSLAERIAALEPSRQSALAAAESRVRMAVERINAARQALTLAEATLTTARLNLDRTRILTDKGLSSRRNRELTELETTRAETELQRAQVNLEAAKAEHAAIVSDRLKLDGDTSAAISDARASLASAQAEIANASAELTRVDVRVTRQSTQAVTVPADGTLLRVVANGAAGELVKAGNILAVLVPTARDRSAEVWVSGNDMPLIQEGAEVRVQFEGWPALQFSGWPQVSVGTFAGRVRVLDATDDGSGRFRILVSPEQQSDWPDPKYLRQGVRVNAWVQLGRVPLGYELWRIFNGFPPALRTPPSTDASKKKDGGKS